MGLLTSGAQSSIFTNTQKKTANPAQGGLALASFVGKNLKKYLTNQFHMLDPFSNLPKKDEKCLKNRSVNIL
jgi:hypothetical protein